MKRLRTLLSVCWVFGICAAYAQTDTSSRKIVDLICADFIRSMQYEGRPINRLIGNVQLFHNDTYMYCDSAYLYSGSRFKAFGHIVMINKDGAKLYGDSLSYDGNINMAQVRGKIVRLVDTTAELRTSILDFDTKDNIGYFYEGGTITNKNSLLESKRGVYYSRQKLFVFLDELEMRDTTYIIRSDSSHYNSVSDIATFFGKTNIWHKDGFLSCFYGRFDRQNDFFHFSSEAYLQTATQEIWSDSMYYYRPLRKGDLYGNVQVLDTAKSMLAFADEAHMLEDPEKVTLTENPSIAYYSVDSTSKRDTLFLRGDTIKLITYKNPKYLPKDTGIQPDSSGKKSLSDTMSIVSTPVDTNAEPPPVAVLPDSLQGHKDTLQQLPGMIIQADSLSPPNSLTHHALGADVSLPKDTAARKIKALAVGKTSVKPTQADTLKIMADDVIRYIKDSLWRTEHPVILLAKKDSVPPSDTILRNVYAYHHVQAYRGDVQMVCDSLVYTTLDSIARLYRRPALWHGTYQISSDSMFFYTREKEITKADFLSSAFLLFYEELPEEDTTYYNQVKGRDMHGYFHENELYQFDVEGGAQTVYFMVEDSLVVNADLAESQRFEASVKNRKIQRMKYISKITSDIYPLDQIPKDKSVLKGFEVREGERPKTRFDVCPRIIKASRREEVSQIPMPSFPITEYIDMLDGKKKLSLPSIKR